MEFDRGTLLPTYRLLLGQPGSSNALAIARRYDLPKEVTDRMEELLKEENEDTSDLINRVQHVKSVAEKARRRNEKLRVKLTQSIKDAEKEKASFKEEAEARISYIMDDVIRETEEFSKGCENAPEPWKSLVAKYRKRIGEIAKGTPREQYRENFLADLAVGQRVYVSNLRAFGETVKINQRQKTARVKVEGLLYDVPFSNLEEKPFAVPDVRKVVKPAPAPKKEKVMSAPAPAVVIRRKPDPNRGQFLAKLKEGDEVFVPQLQSRGRVKRFDKTRSKVRVDLGTIEVQVPLDSLERP